MLQLFLCDLYRSLVQTLKTVTNAYIRLGYIYMAGLPFLFLLLLLADQQALKSTFSKHYYLLTSHY